MTFTGFLIVVGVALFSTFLRALAGRTLALIVDVVALPVLGLMFILALLTLIAPGIPATFSLFWALIFVAYYAGFRIRKERLIDRWRALKRENRSTELENHLFRVASKNQGIIHKGELVEISDGYPQGDVLDKLHELQERGLVEESVNTYVFTDLVRY